MTWLEPQAAAIGAPGQTALGRPYWAAAQEGHLAFQRCADCGAATHTPAVVCSNCVSTALSWEFSAGTGSIYSWTTVWRPVTPAFVTPYVPVVVDLDEGWQMLSNLVHCEHDAVQIGMRVSVLFHRPEGGILMPYFEPVLNPPEGAGS